METISSMFYAAPTQAAKTEKPAKTDDDSPSCCTRITNVFKCIISWIVYIFTFGQCTVFDDSVQAGNEEDAKPVKLTDKQLIANIKKMTSSEMNSINILATILKIKTTETRDDLLIGMVKDQLLKDEKTTVSILEHYISPIKDRVKRHECILHTLKHLPSLRAYTSLFCGALIDLYDVSFEIQPGETPGLVKDVEGREAAILVAVEQITRRMPKIKLADLLQFVGKISEGNVEQRDEATSKIIGVLQFATYRNMAELRDCFDKMTELAKKLKEERKTELAQKAFFGIRHKCKYNASVQKVSNRVEFLTEIANKLEAGDDTEGENKAEILRFIDTLLEK